MANSSKPQSANSRNANRARPSKAMTPPLFTWMVMSNERGVMDIALGVYDEEGRKIAEQLAEEKRQEYPDMLIWVAPWPVLQAAQYPHTPWAEMPHNHDDIGLVEAIDFRKLT